jgi:Peptidase propeptide and YPEB domain
MNRKQSIIAGALAAAVPAATVVYAGESGNEENDAAVRAALEDVNGRMVYGVEVVGSGKSTDVKVDIDTGKVLSVQADRDADEGEHEGRD